MRAEVVSNLAPSNKFIQKAFAIGAHVPPAFTTAVGAHRRLFGRTLFAVGNFREDLVRRNMSEVQIGREPTRDIQFRLIAFFAVTWKPAREEFLQSFAGIGVPTANSRRRNGVIEMRDLMQSMFAFQQCTVRRRPSRCDLLWQLPRRR